MSVAVLAGARSDGRAEAIWLVPLTIMAIGLFAVAQIVGPFHGLSPLDMLALNGSKALNMLPRLLALGLAIQLIVCCKQDPHAPTAAVISWARNTLANPWLVASRIVPLLLMPLVFVGFSSLKMLMPRYMPFWADDAAASLDRILFFGTQPWQLTHALFGGEIATLVIDRLYSVWIVLLSFAICGFALFAPRAERARFFISFTLAWIILGVVGAWLLASAGPCYSALIGAGSAPEFAGLIARLDHLNQALDGRLAAVDWQQVLWRAHVSELYTFGTGISAVPSLHNAIAVLYALAAFRIGRLIGWFMTIYAVIILVGSVHLGWHYAVDGLVGGAAMILIWRWVDRWLVRSGYDAAVSAPQRPAPACVAAG